MAPATEAGWALSASPAANLGVDMGTTRCRCSVWAVVTLPGWQAASLPNQASRLISAASDSCKTEFMDRTAWIVVALCVVGLLLWEFYFAKQIAPRPAPVTAASGHASPTTAPEVRGPSPSPLATPGAVSQGVEAAPTFTEQVETLRNSDVELRLTNRGGGIAEPVMLGHIAEDAKRVVLNSAKHMPIGAMVDDPATPVLPEFVLSRESEKSIRCERATADGI